MMQSRAVPYLEDRTILYAREPSRQVKPPPLPRDTRPSKDRDGRYGVIVAELIEPHYGQFKVQPRVDGLIAVIDLHASLGADCPLFEHEIDARAHAAQLAAGGVTDGGRRA